MKRLLKKGADIDFADKDGYTPLVIAALSGFDSIVRLLLECGADVEHTDKEGFTPLMLIIVEGQEKVWEIATMLLDNNANIEAMYPGTKDSPLSLACGHGRYQVSFFFVYGNTITLSAFITAGDTN